MGHTAVSTIKVSSANLFRFGIMEPKRITKKEKKSQREKLIEGMWTMRHLFINRILLWNRYVPLAH